MDFGFSSLSQFNDSDMGSKEDYDLEYIDPDACLDPVDRLEKYLESEHMYSRQLAARSLLETFQQVREFPDAERVMKVLTTLANDADGVVRTELCEQLAQIGNLCMENRAIFTSGGISYDPLTNDILPIIFRYVMDPNNLVRKTSQTALGDLVERRLVTTEDIVSKVSPIISKLADMDSSEDYRSEAASLLCRLAPIVGAELTEHLFLDHFLNFCTDHIFQIRKICAVSFGSICQVVGNEKTESVLLEKFFCLCTDAIWGVRKACTECFMQVSLSCSSDVRHSHLSAVFMNLIADQSRWVRMAAFVALGGFISTFANPSATGLRLTEEGTIVISEPSVVLDETRKNENLVENVEENVIELKKELVETVNSMTGDGTDPNPEIKTNSSEVGASINSNCVQMVDESGNKMPDFSEPCNNEAVSDFMSDDALYADNDVCSSGNFAEVQSCEIVSGNQIICIGGGDSDEVELKPIVETRVHETDELDALNTPQEAFENGVKESEHSDIILENCIGKEVRCNFNGVANQATNIPGNRIENVLTDKSLSINNHISTEGNFNAVNFCQQNELTDGHTDTTIDTRALDIATDTRALDTATDTRALDICLESYIIRTDSDKMTQQFGSLNFWRQMVPEFSETGLPKDVNDLISSHTENSRLPSSDFELMTATPNLLNSRLLDSVSHLSDSVSISNGEIELLGQMDCRVQESMRDVEPAMENSQPKLTENADLDQPLELEENSSVAPMECDDENHMETMVEPVNQSLALIDELETDEVPLCDEFTNSVRNESCKPLLQLLDDFTDPKNTAMDIGDAVDFDNGVEVDEEEIRELVAAAAKDMSCDIAIYEQNVVPSDLLEQYLSMMDPSCAQRVDGEITRHCAFSLPAVAYTLGRNNWPSLKNLYMTLAADVQWKVRRTLAFSIHELALIVGEEIASRDLIPVFDGFLNDLDEVRIGVLNHLADFVKLLPVDGQHVYLLKIAELLKTDNSRNWRFRKEMARQLFLLLDLFTVADIQEHIFPIAIRLAEDSVAQVRLGAVQVLSHILRQLVRCVEGGEGHFVWMSYLDKLEEQFASSNRSTKRQMYVQLCDCILQDRVISDEFFADKFLLIFLSLRHDAIPNVRLTLARTIAQHIRHSEFFLSSKNPHHDEVRQAVAALQDDQDRDVRFLINMKPNDVVEGASVEIIA